MQKEKMVIAMSGGVDSSVCALMMRDLGYDCIGMTMRLWKGKEAEESCSTKSCCGDDSVEDARLVAAKVGIPYYPVNMKEEFWEDVVEVFAENYFSGKTPSPCILCNEKMKFETLYNKAKEIGAQKVCTGHYARILYNEETGRWNLLKGMDASKDQSYFLFSMTQEQLSKTLFPLGEFHKPTIREMALDAGLVTAKKPESQDICFIPDGDYAAFLERHFPDRVSQKEGTFVTKEGHVVGHHEGAHHFTVGQRRGLKMAFGEPIYVTHIDAEKNCVTVGPREELLRSRMVLERMNWVSVNPPPGTTLKSFVKVRSRSPEAAAKILVLEENFCEVIFDEPQSALTPGQAAVFYEGDSVVGGGWIKKVLD